MFKKIDIYGHKINLNYMGDETYNTCPSAFISLLTIFFTITSLYPKFEDFIYNKGISINSQIVLLNEIELHERIELGNYSDFIIGLEF